MKKRKLSRSELYNQGETVSASGLARLIGVTVTNIKKLTDQGLPFQVDGNVKLFDTIEATKWVIQHEIDKALPADEDGERMGVMEAKRRFEVAKMLTAELALAKEREQLADIDDLMNNFIDALVQVRAKIVSQSSRLSGILSHQDEESINEILEKDATDTLEALSSYKHEYIGNKSPSETENRAGDNGRNLPFPFPAPKA